MPVRIILRLVALLPAALLLALTAGATPICCAEGPGKIIFAHQDRVADAASIIAVNQGFFKQEGLDVAGRMFTDGPSCAEALIYGNAVFGSMGDAAAIITLARSRGRFRAIASHGGGERRHRIIVRKDSGIHRPDQL
ncbi:MAG: ABC transporter substrate-binding protein, partial [Desulfobacterales bacterium]|nr:ABC transporter substrate-binding protein [Desulfobacterales bacterium]